MEKLVIVSYDKYQRMLVARGGSTKRETIPKVAVYPPPRKRDTLKSKKGTSPLNTEPFYTTEIGGWHRLDILLKIRAACLCQGWNFLASTIASMTS